MDCERLTRRTEPWPAETDYGNNPDFRKGKDAVIEFKLPELGENIEQGDLVRLMVAPGASVSTGQSVMELETDKAVVEVPSSVSGTVQEIRVKEGDKIKVGQVIFTVDGAEAKASSEPPARAAAPAPVQQKPAQQEPTEVASPAEPATVAPPPLLPRPLQPPHPPPLVPRESRKRPVPANSNFPSSGKIFPKAIWFA